MSHDPTRGCNLAEPRRLARLLIVLAGITLGQAILYGPSLARWKILLPLDVLAEPGYYLPVTPEDARIEMHNVARTDLIDVNEPARRFAAAELHAGRFPMWTPYNFAGAPFIWPKFSPFLALQCATTSPVVLAWSQLLTAIVAGLGAYLFCRRVLTVSFWPATIASWCYPLTGFFVLWQGYNTCLPVVWLPWMFLAVDKTARGPSALAPIGLTVVSALVLTSGQLDVAGQVLLISGLYGVWCLYDAYPTQCLQRPAKGASGSCHEFSSPSPQPSPPRRGRGRTDDSLSRFPDASVLPNDCRGFPLSPAEGERAGVRGHVAALYRGSNQSWSPARKAASALVLAWGLGFLLAAPYILPVLEYTHTGARMARRGAGAEERFPVGLKALPQTVLPYMYGTMQTGSVRLDAGNQAGNEIESSAAAYAGVLATLLVAPLAWCSRRHRSMNLVLALLAFLSLSWSLNVPGLVNLLRLPGLNMMSHNRLVFVACFAIVAMMAIGLEVFRQGPKQWRWWFWLPAALMAGLCAWCAYRVITPPEPIATRLAAHIQKGHSLMWIHDLDGVRRVQSWFARYYAVAAVLCGVGVAGWVLMWARRPWQARLLPVLGVLLVGDLLWFAQGRSAQCAPALYYPPLPVLEQIIRSVPGRMIGLDCLPALVASISGVRDIRGYDGVDPARLIDLTALVASPQSIRFPYAQIQKLSPKAMLGPHGELKLSPVLDMLGVRYLVGRGSPPPNSHPAFQGADYWMLMNSNALPRVFVPRRVEMVPEDVVRLEKLGAQEFDPREVAYVESAVNLSGPCRGTAEITEEVATRIVVSVRTESPGLVVLADLWDKGWEAYLNGQRVPILRTNHAVRGVVVPAGAGVLEFRYAPAGLAWGLRLACLAAAALLVWVAITLRRHRTAQG